MSRHREGDWWHIPILQELLKCYPKPRTYLEVGVDHAKCINAMLDLAECYGCDVKESSGHEMTGGWFYNGTSNEFFKDYDGPTPDVIFIDGDHRYEQAQQDLNNALELIGRNGTVALHDTFSLGDPACGTVYQLLPEIQAVDYYPEYTSYTYRTWPGLTLVQRCSLES